MGNKSIIQDNNTHSSYKHPSLCTHRKVRCGRFTTIDVAFNVSLYSYSCFELFHLDVCSHVPKPIQQSPAFVDKLCFIVYPVIAI